MRAAVPIALLLTLTAATCGRDGGGASFGGASEPSVTTVPGDIGDESASSSSTSSAASSTSNGPSESSGFESGNASTFDMPPPDFPDPPPIGCRGKIDFLFVISTSGTMTGHQQLLQASFKPFMEAIQTKLPDFNVHVMSAATDIIWKFAECSDCAGDGCDPEGALPLCGAEREDCDEVRGAGVRFPVGKEAANERCNIVGGNRYLVNDEPDLAEAFACIAKVGISGSKSTAETMVAALSAEVNEPSGCNSGFLRDDALLVVTIIDDGFDEDSVGDVDSWIDALRLAKRGDDQAYMVLVLTTDIDEEVWGECDPGTFIPYKNRLRLLVEGVDNGSIGSICEKSYEEFFAATVDDVVTLCEDFVPPPG